MKTCTKCGVEKDESCFGKHILGKGGIRPTCKECHKLSSREYYSKNRESINIRGKDRAAKYYHKNRCKVLKRMRENVDQRKKNVIQKRYYARWAEKLLYVKRERDRVDREEISDHYVVSLISKRRLPKHLITAEFIDATRAIIKIKRELCQIKKQSQQM